MGRDSGNSREHRLRNLVHRSLELLGVHRAIASERGVGSSAREQREPQRRVTRVRAPDHPNSLPHDGENHAPDRSRLEGPRIEIASFDQEVGQPGRAPQLADLTPEATSFQRQAQVGHRLAFDHDPVAEEVVASRESLDIHGPATASKSSGYSACKLEPIDDDAAHRQQEAYEGIGSDSSPGTLF
jgi:hypothetical protein